MALPVTDLFGRALMGSDWFVSRGTFIIYNTDVAQPNDAGLSHSTYLWQTDTFPNDHFAEGVIANATFDQYAGICVRGSLTGQATFYVYHGSMFEQNVSKFVDNTYTSLSTIATGIANGDILRLEISGSTLIAKRNGTAVYTGTDSAIASGAAGIQGYTSVLATPNTGLTSWNAGAIVSASLPDHKILRGVLRGVLRGI